MQSIVSAGTPVLREGYWLGQREGSLGDKRGMSSGQLATKPSPPCSERLPEDPRSQHRCLQGPSAAPVSALRLVPTHAINTPPPKYQSEAKPVKKPVKSAQTQQSISEQKGGKRQQWAW